jgi:hypothetical protein
MVSSGLDTAGRDPAVNGVWCWGFNQTEETGAPVRVRNPVLRRSAHITLNAPAKPMPTPMADVRKRSSAWRCNVKDPMMQPRAAGARSCTAGVPL